MLCIRCGRRLNDKSRFCDECGLPTVSAPSGVNLTSAVSQNNPKRNWWKLVVPIVLVIVFLSVIFYFRHGSAPDTHVNKKVSPEKLDQPAISSFSSATGWMPFDPDVSSLPARYVALDPEKLWSALVEREGNEHKDNYESTEEHRKRVASLDKEPIIGQITLNSKVALPVESSKSFDADRKVVIIRVAIDEPENGFLSFLSKGTKYEKPSYIGSTAFGVQGRVIPILYEYYSVVFPKVPHFRVAPYEGHGTLGIVFELNADKDNAPEFEKNLRVLAIGRPHKRYIKDFKMETKPTITKPEEEKYSYNYISATISGFWLYDSRDGKILQRMKADGRPPS